MDASASEHTFAVPVHDDPAARRLTGRLADHLGYLGGRREAALEAGDMAAVAEYEDRIVSVEMFAMSLERWRMPGLALAR